MSNFNFNADDHDDVSFEPLPAGEYLAVVEDSEIKEVKSNPDNLYLQCMFTIIGDDYAGRKVWQRFNIQNHNETAQKIGLGQLKRLSLACGLHTFADSAELHDIPVIIKLKIISDNYGDKNEIVSYKSANDEPAADPALTQKPATKDKPASKQNPWRKK